jgi:hypothetical protein
MDLGEMGCEDGRWMELAQDCVRLQALDIRVNRIIHFYVKIKVGGTERVTKILCYVTALRNIVV